MPSRLAAVRAAPQTLFVLVFCSGASSLVLEMVWIRALGLSFGTSTPAIATVVAAFMAGLAVGSLLFGRLADRSARPLRLYSYLELSVALSGLAVSFVLLRGGDQLLGIARAVGATGALAVWARAAVVFLILLLPTTLMGGTLPVLARTLVREPASGKTMGALYAANTAGAVLGALIPAAYSVRAFGFLMTSLAAAGVDLGVAAAARSLTLPAPAPSAPTTTGRARLDRRALALFAASGFLSLGAEIAWNRVLEHLVGGTSIAFAILLVVYLAALAFGSQVASGPADRSSEPLLWAAASVAGSAFLTLASIRSLGLWMDWFPPESLPRATVSWTWQASIVDSLCLEGGASVLMGMGFPFLAARVIRLGQAGEAIGVLYAANTLAGVAGSLLTGFVFLPAFGLQRTLMLLCTFAAVAAAFIAGERGKGWRLAPIVALALGVIALGATQPAGQLSAQLFRDSDPRLSLDEGSTTSVAVFSHAATRTQESFRDLSTPAVSMSDTSFAARRYQGMMAHLPLLLAKPTTPSQVLLICFGVGNTARSILSHPEVGHLDVVDVSAEVLKVSPLFAAVTGSDPLRDPRTQVHIEDGRYFLGTTATRYDVITAEPPPPYDAGVVNLYSREYYRAGRRALRPGGVLAQWLPVFELTPGESLSMVASMAAEFPHVALYYGYQEQWIVLGSDQPLQVDVPSWTEKISAPTIQSDLHRMGVHRVEELVASYMQSDAAIRSATATVDLISDDRPLLQYPTEDVAKVPLLAHGLIGEPEQLFAEVARPSPLTRPAFGALGLLLRSMEQRFYSPQEEEQAMATSLSPVLAVLPGAGDVMAMLGVSDDLVREARAGLAQDPESTDAIWVLARRDFYEGHWASAEARLASLDPEPELVGRYWLLRGGCERALGRARDAAESFRKSGEAGSNHRFQGIAQALGAQTAKGVPWDLQSGPLSLAAE